MSVPQVIVGFLVIWSVLGLINFRSLSKANPNPSIWHRVIVTFFCGPILWVIALIAFFEHDDTDFPDHGGAA